MDPAGGGGRPRISIVVPALNEEKNLRDAVHGVHRQATPFFSELEVLIVNDGSTDRTAEVAEACARDFPHTRVIHHERPWGLGGSVRHGFEMARHPYVMYVSGDNEIEPASLTVVYEAAGRADMIIPHLTNLEDRGFVRKTISRTYTALVNGLFGFRMRYFNGHVLYRREQVISLPPWTPSMAFQAEILVQLLSLGASYHMVPYQFQAVTGRRTKAFHLWHVREVLKAILRLFWRLRVRPLVRRPGALDRPPPRP